jgi:hypothetical protein
METKQRTPMFAHMNPKSCAGYLASFIVCCLIISIAADSALADRKIYHGAPPANATSNRAVRPSANGSNTDIVRDHRGQRAGPPPQQGGCRLYRGHWTGYGCNPGTIRDHRH